MSRKNASRQQRRAAEKAVELGRTAGLPTFSDTLTFTVLDRIMREPAKDKLARLLCG